MSVCVSVCVCVCVSERLNELGKEDEKGNIPEDQHNRSSRYVPFTDRLWLYRIKEKYLFLSFLLSL